MNHTRRWHMVYLLLNSYLGRVVANLWQKPYYRWNLKKSIPFASQLLIADFHKPTHKWRWSIREFKEQGVSKNMYWTQRSTGRERRCTVSAQKMARGGWKGQEMGWSEGHSALWPQAPGWQGRGIKEEVRKRCAQDDGKRGGHCRPCGFLTGSQTVSWERKGKFVRPGLSMEDISICSTPVSLLHIFLLNQYKLLHAEQYKRYFQQYIIQVWFHSQQVIKQEKLQ